MDRESLKFGRRLRAIPLLQIGLRANILRPEIAKHFVLARRLEQCHCLCRIATIYLSWARMTGMVTLFSSVSSGNLLVRSSTRDCAAAPDRRPPVHPQLLQIREISRHRQGLPRQLAYFATIAKEGRAHRLLQQNLC